MLSGFAKSKCGQDIPVIEKFMKSVKIEVNGEPPEENFVA